jgi:hypothetical protein
VPSPALTTVLLEAWGEPPIWGKDEQGSKRASTPVQAVFSGPANEKASFAHGGSRHEQLAQAPWRKFWASRTPIFDPARRGSATRLVAEVPGCDDAPPRNDPLARLAALPQSVDLHVWDAG